MNDFSYHINKSQLTTIIKRLLKTPQFPLCTKIQLKRSECQLNLNLLIVGALLIVAE